jgi:hypothetical protein
VGSPGLHDLRLWRNDLIAGRDDVHEGMVFPAACFDGVVRAAYFVEQATRPETIGYALLDSPVAMAAWMVDHDTDAY